MQDTAQHALGLSPKSRNYLEVDWELGLASTSTSASTCLSYMVWSSENGTWCPLSQETIYSGHMTRVTVSAGSQNIKALQTQLRLITVCSQVLLIKLRTEDKNSQTVGFLSCHAVLIAYWWDNKPGCAGLKKVNATKMVMGLAGYQKNTLTSSDRSIRQIWNYCEGAAKWIIRDKSTWRWENADRLLNYLASVLHWGGVNTRVRLVYVVTVPCGGDRSPCS